MARSIVSRAKAALTGKASTEDTIRGLESTKAGLEARLPALEAAKAAALDERREALISGDDAADAAVKVRAADDDLTAVADALAEVDRRLVEAVARRDAETAQAKRDDVAKALEADAEAIVAAARDIAAAVAQAVRAHARLTLAVSPTAAPQLMDGRPHLSPAQFADGVLVEALVAALPEIAIRADTFPGVYSVEHRVEGRDPREQASASAERLREIAAQVRSGDAAPELREWEDGGPSIRVSEPPTSAAFPLRCFSWIDRHGQTRHATPSTFNVPQPVAEAAFAAGLARRSPDHDTESAKGRWEARLYDSYGHRRDVTFEELLEGVTVEDLGVNLQADAEAEAERQRAEWRTAMAARRADLERRAA